MYFVRGVVRWMPARGVFMKMSWAILAMVFAAFPLVSASSQDSKAGAPNEAKPSVAHAAKPGTEYSGMYSFLKDGEFVQITVEDEGTVTGFISRYGEGGSDNGTFLDQYFRSGKLEGSSSALPLLPCTAFGSISRERWNAAMEKIPAMNRITC